MTKAGKWSGRTGGTHWMQQCLIVMLRRVDVRLLYAVMAIVVPFYMLFSRRSYKAVYCYFHDRLGHGPWRSFCKVYANHYAFGQVVLDRFAVYAGHRFEVNIIGNEYFMRTAEGRSGAVLLSAHVGNFELCGYMLHSTAKHLNALVFGGEGETVLENRARLWGNNNIRMIPVRDDLSHLFAINAAVNAGDFVCMTADRTLGSQKTVSLPFFGHPAHFPLGPFALARQLDVPVLTLFVMKEKARAYRIYVEPLNLEKEELTLSRRKQMDCLAARFAGRLEKLVRRYPEQWFNYYDFWSDE